MENGREKDAKTQETTPWMDDFAESIINIKVSVDEMVRNTT